MATTEFPDKPTLIAACIPDNLINKHTATKVYRIPGYPQFVLRCRSSDPSDILDATALRVPDRLEGRKDFGQICVKYSNSATLNYFQPGLPNSSRDAAEYFALRRIIADEDSGVYEQLMADMLFLRKKGISLDPKASNIMIDKGKRFGLVDVGVDTPARLTGHADTNYCNMPEAAAIMLINNNEAIFHAGTDEAEMRRTARMIIEKIVAAAEKIGLTPDAELRNDSSFAYSLKLAGLADAEKEAVYQRLEAIVPKQAAGSGYGASPPSSRA